MSDEYLEALQSISFALESLSKRLESVESYVAKQLNQRDTRVSLRILDGTRSDTLQQALKEVSAQLGFSKEQFLSRFQEAARWHYDRRLQKASDSAPNLSARIDDRDLDQIPTDESPPQIFPQ